MDFLDPRKKRAQTIRLIVGYVLIAIATGLASTILWLQVHGFDLNRQTGQVVQNGLVFVSSHPVSANVYLNGISRGKTNTKFTIPAGQYKVDLKQTGYRDWSRSFSVEGGSVVQLVYPLLFPQKLVTNDVQLYGNAPSLSTESPDRHWLVVEQPGSMTAFDDFDLTKPSQPAVALNLPSDLVTAATGTQSLSLVEWSTDNHHVLLKHTFSGGDEYIMLDRDTPSASFNVNKLFASQPTSVALRNKHYDQLYLYNAANLSLQTADFKTKRVTPLLSDVVSYKAYGSDTVLYASHNSQKPNTDTIKMWDGKQNYTIHTYPASSSYVLDMAGYAGDNYAVVAPQAAGYIYIYKNPLTVAKSHQLPQAFTTLKMEQATHVSFSTTSQFIMAQNSNRFAVYDIDANRRYYYVLPDQITPDQIATWMDGNRLLMIIKNQTVVFDFDGVNRQTLTASLPDFIPIFDQNYTHMFNIAPSTQVQGRYALTETAMTAKK